MTDRSMNELFDRVEEIINEHGYITGQEVLDLTDNDFELQRAYAAYWDAVVIPDIAARIQSRIAKLKEIQRQNGWE